MNRYQIIILAALFLAALRWYGYAATGDVTILPNSAFRNLSGNGGKIRSSAGSTVYFNGSSVTVNPTTRTVTISGTGGGTDTTLRADFTAYTSSKTLMTDVKNGNKYRFEIYSGYLSIVRVP